MKVYFSRHHQLYIRHGINEPCWLPISEITHTDTDIYIFTDYGWVACPIITKSEHNSWLCIYDKDIMMAKCPSYHHKFKGEKGMSCNVGMKYLTFNPMEMDDVFKITHTISKHKTRPMYIIIDEIITMIAVRYKNHQPYWVG